MTETITLTRAEAIALIETYCGDVPRDDAIDRLLAAELPVCSLGAGFVVQVRGGINDPDAIGVRQDDLDHMLYGADAIARQRAYDHAHHVADFRERLRREFDAATGDDDQTRRIEFRAACRQLIEDPAAGDQSPHERGLYGWASPAAHTIALARCGGCPHDGPLWMAVLRDAEAAVSAAQLRLAADPALRRSLREAT